MRTPRWVNGGPKAAAQTRILTLSSWWWTCWMKGTVSLILFGRHRKACHLHSNAYRMSSTTETPSSDSLTQHCLRYVVYKDLFFFLDSPIFYLMPLTLTLISIYSLRPKFCSHWGRLQNSSIYLIVPGLTSLGLVFSSKLQVGVMLLTSRRVRWRLVATGSFGCCSSIYNRWGII